MKLLITLLLVPMIAVLTSAQQEKCLAQGIITVQVITRIRDNYGWSSQILRGARPGDTFEILQTVQDADGCWIETSDGWLHGHTVSADTGSTRNVVTQNTDGGVQSETPTSTAQPGCYDESIAYVHATMNIRSAASADAERVAQAHAGDVFVVTDSVQGEHYCWLEISAGWMAQTGRIRSELPAASLPRIDGNAAFVEQIQAGLDYLKDEALEWYLYVIKPSYTIRPAPTGETTTYMYPSERRMEVLERHLTPPINLASVMAHEVCHLYQQERGVRVRIWDEEGRVRVEKECIRVQIDLITAIEPDHWTIPLYEEQLAKPWRDWD